VAFNGLYSYIARGLAGCPQQQTVHCIASRCKCSPRPTLKVFFEDPEKLNLLKILGAMVVSVDGVSGSRRGGGRSADRSVGRSTSVSPLVAPACLPCARLLRLAGRSARSLVGECSLLLVTVCHLQMPLHFVGTRAARGASGGRDEAGVKT
jgi:hypothetical protein